MITSFQNDRVKLAHALIGQANARRKEAKIALEGTRLIRDAIERGGCRPDFILHDASHGPVQIPALQPFADHLHEVSPEVIQRLSATERSQGIVGVFPMPAPRPPAKPERTLILDNLRDPGNLGTILRTSAGAGIDLVLLAPGCVDLYNDKVLRGGMGVHFRLPILERSWAEIRESVRGVPVHLADLGGDLSYDAVDWTGPHALIIGSEADGASPDARSLATNRIHIPLSAATESLNAAVAAGVILFEASRQRATGR